MANYKNTEVLLAKPQRAKTKRMGIICVAQYQKLRFMVMDFTTGKDVEFGFAMTTHENDEDVWGKPVGQTVSIPPALIKEARASAKRDKLNEDDTELRIIAFVLTQGGLAGRLRQKCGKVPAIVSRTLGPMMRAVNDKEALEQVIEIPAVRANRPRL